MRRLQREIENADVLCIRTATKIDKALMDRGKKLKYILSFTSGIDHIDIEYAQLRGIEVIWDKLGGVSDSVAEFTIGLMINLARRISYAHERMKMNIWAKGECMGMELRKKTLGIIGCGRIGSKVAKIAKLGLEMRVIGYDPYLKRHEYVQLTSLNDVLMNSDIITIHVPLTDETRNMIGKREFELMGIGKKPYIINTSRGGVIDLKELYLALKRGLIKGVAMDVYVEEPPFKDELFTKIKELEGEGRVLFTPHIAGSTLDGKEMVGRNVIDLFLRHLRGLSARNRACIHPPEA